VKVGDKVQEFDEICLVESDKATVTITSRYQGTIKRLHYNVDDVAKVGHPLIDIEVDEDGKDGEAENVDKRETPIAEPSTPSSAPPSANHATAPSGKLLTTPAVRRLIKENNLDPSTLNGTGPQGRLLKEDVLKAIKPTKAISRAEEPKGIMDGEGGEKVVPIRGYTRAMIKSMSEALKIPHFGFDDEYIVDELIQLRQELKDTAKQKGIKLSYMPFIIKATSLALKEFPVLNSSMDERMENLIYKNYHNISLAIDTPRGLAVPNIKHCERKTIWEIAVELNRLADAGKQGTFGKEDMANGTFSLSNIGAIGGGTYMKPIIFPPQVAIGAIGQIRKLPRYDEESASIAVRSVMNFSWAADHRVIDGATMARFSNRLKEFLECPSLMLAELR